MPKNPLVRFFIAALAISFIPAGEATAQAPLTKVTSFEDALTVLPREIITDLRRLAKKDEAVIKGTDMLREKVEGRPATFKFTVLRLEKFQDREDKSDRYRIRADEESLRKNGTSFVAILWVVLDPSENSKTPTVTPGRIMSVSGKITSASVTSVDAPELRIEISHAKIE